MALTRRPADLPRHGGDLAFAAERYGHPAGDWLDISTGINPNPWPVPTLAAAAFSRLPQRDATERLLGAARHAYGIADAATLIAVPGSELAIRLLPLIAPPGPVAIVAPTYGSHAQAWHRAGRTVDMIPSLDHVPEAARVVVLANPNNPDGRTVAAASLAAIAHRLGARGGLLVVDEAFADIAPDTALDPMLAGLDALVLRSFGKFYGLPGLRLGFVAGAPTIVQALAGLLGDWPVSGPALALGAAALADAAWQNATRRRLAHDAARLRKLLTDAGLSLVGGTDLFALAAHERAGDIHDGLARQGVWTRAFEERPDWLRFGLPANDAGFARLAMALRMATEVSSPPRG